MIDLIRVLLGGHFVFFSIVSSSFINLDLIPLNYRVPDVLAMNMSEINKIDENKDLSVIDKLFDYDNYRILLKDYFEEQRELKSFFSHRYFAQRAGFGSHSFCAYIMDGKRNLSHTSIPKMVKGLGLKGKKAEYFTTLVNYNQSRNEKDRDVYYKALQRLRKSRRPVGGRPE